ncbi:MAG: OmpA family protein [Bacteroidetes bacterium]|nr:OmpA family protein [Bacteroidota bacterium]MDA1119560.1 OmpA family protein [Bacteroidota bacterium]
MKLKLFFAELDEDRNLENLTSFKYNDDEYSTAHPFLSKDGKTLYFTSDMPGGFGGTDLYVSRLEENVWTTPTNLGSSINTEDDEMFPFASGDKIYFSSDGHGGFGGLDIYFSINTNDSFTQVVNLGFPANSAADDFSFIMNDNGRQGLFASNRNSKSHDNIYNFFIRHSIVAGQVIEVEENYPIEGVNVSLLDMDGRTMKETISDSLGRFHLDLPLDTDYTLEISKKDYTPSHNDKSYDNRNTFDIDSVKVFMWAHDLFAGGTIYSNETQQMLSDVKVTLENLTASTSENTITNELGEYEFLIEYGNEYLLTFDKELYVPLSHPINTLNIKKGTIRNDFVMEEQFLEKGLVLFDYNEDVLKSDYEEEVNKILKFLKRNSSVVLVISAHADSRGTEEYNLELSERRANNVLKYFLENNISSNRIIARGFGESLIINRCTDGINCHEEDHYKNRRAELKIEKEFPTDQSLN